MKGVKGNRAKRISDQRWTESSTCAKARNDQLPCVIGSVHVHGRLTTVAVTGTVDADFSEPWGQI